MLHFTHTPHILLTLPYINTITHKINDINYNTCNGGGGTFTQQIIISTDYIQNFVMKLHLATSTKCQKSENFMEACFLPDKYLKRIFF